MTPLGGSDEFDRYKEVLEESRNYGGCFEWKRVPAVWVAENLECQPRAVERLIYENRDKIRQREEKRQDYRHIYSFYYSLVISIDGQQVFIETVFEPGPSSDRDKIRVVSIHPAT